MITRLGKYELQTQLGHGGTAEVWKALDTQLQRHVAIKLLHADLQEDPQFVTRFEHEAQLVASLHHPNIVQVHDFQIVRPPEVEHTIAYMVMEYIEGQTLADYIQSTSGQGHIPLPADIVQLFTSIALAVDYAHQKGVVHRDIKPANILLDKRHTERNRMGEPALTDFGIAKMLGTSSGTLTGAQLSTPLYISPEQVKGYPGNERSDLYALGVILYETVTGVLPFRGESATDVMAQHLHATPPSPSLFNPNIPLALTMVILRSLAKDPDSRFPSAASMVAALAESLTIAVPESLGKPAYPVDTPDMPTRIGPLPDISKTSSTPVISTTLPAPVVAAGTSIPHALTPTYSSQTLPAAMPHQTPSFSTSSIPRQGNQPAQATPILGARTARGRHWKPLYTALAALLIVVVLGSSIYYLTLVRPAVGTDIVGHAYYTSSGQLNGVAQGVADQVRIDITNVSPPAAGKNYCAWLLPDRVRPNRPGLPMQTPILLTNNLPVKSGEIHYFYPGDAQHNDLLSTTSRFLITQEDTGTTPHTPSTDRSTWTYYAELPQVLLPGGATTLRGIDHIRHLFSNDPTLDELGLHGGLDIWLFRNTEKVLEWSISARDDFDPTGKNYTLMHDLFLRVLEYLDGIPNVQVDIPSSTNTPILVDPTIARVAILTIDPNQVAGKLLATSPPGYLAHLPLHVQQALRAPDATSEIKTLAPQILDALNHAQVWFTQVRKDAKALFAMSPAQLSQPAARDIMDDMVTQATYAYIGQLDPATNKVTSGVLQAHYDIQKLATFDITKSVPDRL
jgi:serine/threonine protein kinase